MFFNSVWDLVLQQLWHVIGEGCERKASRMKFERYLSLAIDSSDKKCGEYGDKMRG